MESFRETIKKLRQRDNKSQKDIADKLGVSQVSIFNLEAGKIKVTDEYIRKYAELYNVDPMDLLKENPDIPSIRIEDSRIDIISAIPCCGNGNEVTEEVIGTFRLPNDKFKAITSSNPSNCKMLQVSGDSMQPTINDGDFVIVDTSHIDIGDGIYLIRSLSGLVVKRIQVKFDNIAVLSDNPLYQPVAASMGELQIIGRVIKILKILSV
jgi:phage repressor protein C with HTH and peptisase S24 domain